MYTLISKDNSELLYKRLQSAHMIAALVCGKDFEKYTEFMVAAIVKSVGQLVSEINDEPNFSQELMKKELTEGMNKCLENAALVEEFGELWMAREGKLVEIVETIADTLVKKMLADYQAINN